MGSDLIIPTQFASQNAELSNSIDNIFVDQSKEFE
jgi:hypothetical protein